MIQPSPLPPPSRFAEKLTREQRDKDLCDVRRASLMETLIGSLGLLLVIVLSGFLLLMTQRLKTRERDFVQETALLQENLQRAGDQQNLAVKQLTHETSLVTKLRNSRGALDKAKAQLRTVAGELGMPAIDTEHNFAEFLDRVKDLKHNLAQTATNREKMLSGQKRELEQKINAANQLAISQQGQIVTLTKEREAAQKSLDAALEKQTLHQTQLADRQQTIAKLTLDLDAIKNRPPREIPVPYDADVILKTLDKYRTPDANLATFVVLVDSQTNLDFLEQDMIDFFTLQNYGRTDRGFVAVDVAQSGKLKGGGMSFPDKKDKPDFGKLVNAMALSRNTRADAEKFAAELKREFLDLSKEKKRHQVILIVGEECKAPSLEAWKSFPHPVHACVISNGTPLPADKQQAWTSFCRTKNGTTLFVAEKLNDSLGQSVARGKINSWMNERLLLMPPNLQSR